MKKSTENILKVGMNVYNAGVCLLAVGLVKHGIDLAVDYRQAKKAKKAAKEKAAE